MLARTNSAQHFAVDQPDVRIEGLPAGAYTLIVHAGEEREQSFDFVVIGSGYGGAITASRLVTSDLNPKPTVCLLERGKEWPVGSFPDTLEGYLAQTRSSTNPLGLYELLNYPHISVLKGSGLGGTSLVNANVAIEPDEDTFTRAGWPGNDWSGSTRLKYLYRLRRVTLKEGANVLTTEDWVSTWWLPSHKAPLGQRKRLTDAAEAWR